MVRIERGVAYYIAARDPGPLSERSHNALARAIHATVEIDQEIQADHYKAVAEVIGYVMRLNRSMARK